MCENIIGSFVNAFKVIFQSLQLTCGNSGLAGQTYEKDCSSKVSISWSKPAEIEHVELFGWWLSWRKLSKKAAIPIYEEL